jgi:hypothetical protein
MPTVDRNEFETATKPIYDELRRNSERFGWKWIVRDREPEYILWNSMNVMVIKMVRGGALPQYETFVTEGETYTSMSVGQVLELITLEFAGSDDDHHNDPND